uniref:Uncharacterized protein n=1 Tax=Medicago truncatula TaxID=3880 RepID=I3SMV3_MEDTR|nr:unknown [Medicago truncatula]
MSKSNQVNKSNDGGPIPNFSIGLTQLEQEQASDEDKGKKKGKKMEKRVKKTKELEPLPSFSIGLTQIEEEGRNEEAKSSDMENEENAKQRLSIR